MSQDVTPQITPAPAANEATIDAMVRRFYDLCLDDAELGPMFREAIPDLEGHLKIIIDFWVHHLLGQSRYKGNMFMSHAKLPLTAEHFDIWLRLFAQAVNEHLPESLARMALGKAQHMAKSIKVGLLTVPGVKFGEAKK